MTNTDTLPRDYLAQVKALKEKFFTTKPVVMRPVSNPVERPLVRIVRPFVPDRPERHPQADEAREAILQVRGFRYAAQEFIARYAVWCGLTYDDLTGTSRKICIAHPRQDCMAALHRVRPDLSLPQLGKLFNRDHTTILHGICVSEKRAAEAIALAEVAS